MASKAEAAPPHVEETVAAIAELHAAHYREAGALQKFVEADQTLVHGAYYSDDECIDRIADWIADGGSANTAERDNRGAELLQAS